MLHVIYKATNTVNDKAYIGYSSNFVARQAKHLWHSKNTPKTHFHRALANDNFIWEILYESDDKEVTWLVMEEHFIRLHKTHAEEGNGYNYSFGGLGRGKVFTEEAKLNMAASAKKRKPQSKLTRDRRTQSNRGKKRSPAFCEAVSLINSGRVHSVQSKINMSNAHKKKYEIDGEIYIGLDDAANGLKLSKSQLIYGMKTGKIQYTKFT